MTDKDSQRSAAELDEKTPDIKDIVVVDVLANDAGEHPFSPVSKAEEKRLVRKLDWRILPMLCIVFLFSDLVKTSLGNARLLGLPQDILHGDPTGVLFDWTNTAFYFTYVTCEIPSIIMLKLYSARAWIGCLAIGWAISGTLMASAFNFPGIFVARLAVGAFQAGFSPGFPWYLSLFYTREEMGRRMATWFTFSIVSGAFGGLIAFGISHVDAKLANWRLLFLVEGVPSIFLGILAFVVLPDRPEETSVLTEREREIAVQRVNRGTKTDPRRVIEKKHVMMAFGDWKLYAAAVMYFAVNCAQTTITAFLPTIIASFGFSDTVAQILTVPPYAVAVVILAVVMHASDRLQRRGMFLAGAGTLGGIGYILLLAIPSNIHLRYFATFCIVSATYVSHCLIFTWFSHNLGSETKKTLGMPLYMSLGHVGNILGSHLFPKTDAPHYVMGFAVTLALEVNLVVIATILTVYYTAENRRRDEKYGKPLRDAPVDISVLADKAPNFRYTP